MLTVIEDIHISNEVHGAERNKQGACGATESANGFYPLGWGFESLQARMIQKKCHACGDTKDIIKFCKKPGQRVGTRAVCEECIDENRFYFLLLEKD